MKIPIIKVDREVLLTAKEYEILNSPGDNIPPGIDPDDWHAQRVIVVLDIHGVPGLISSIRNYLAPGQLCDWDKDVYRLGLKIDADGAYQTLTIPKTDLNDPADFTSVKVALPPEVISLTATEVEIPD